MPNRTLNLPEATLFEVASFSTCCREMRSIIRWRRRFASGSRKLVKPRLGDSRAAVKHSPATAPKPSYNEPGRFAFMSIFKACRGFVGVLGVLLCLGPLRANAQGTV